MDRYASRCLDLKCDPVLSRLLRETYRGILPAYHMNKTHWITVRLHADVPDEEVEKLGMATHAAAPDFEVGENVQIVSGPLEGFIGTIRETHDDTQRAKVTIVMFGREQDVEVEYVQMKKISPDATEVPREEEN